MLAIVSIGVSSDARFANRETASLSLAKNGHLSRFEGNLTGTNVLEIGANMLLNSALMVLVVVHVCMYLNSFYVHTLLTKQLFRLQTRITSVDLCFE